MREPSPDTEVFGVLAEFDTPEHLVAAVRRVRREGIRSFDAYTPFPVEELTEAIGIRENIVPWLTFAGGFIGAAAGYGLQLWTNHAYPIEIGGRPIIAWQPFMLITFEMTVLGAVLSAVLSMLLLNRLPRLHHPVFDVEDFHLASSDKFFLIVFSNDAGFEARRIADFLNRLSPVRVSLVEHTEPA